MKTSVPGVLLLLCLFLLQLPTKAQNIAPIELLQSSNQSYISVRPEVTLFSKTPAPVTQKGEFTINPGPAGSVSYGKRYGFIAGFGIELSVSFGITRFAYSTVAPKQQFPPRDYTFENHQSLGNAYLSAPLLLSYQKPINNKYLFTASAGPDFRIYIDNYTSSEYTFSNGAGGIPSGKYYDVYLAFTNKPVIAGIRAGAGVGKLLPNHNILHLNLWANVGLTERIRGVYHIYNQEWDPSGQFIQDIPVGEGLIQSKGSMVGTEIRYTFTGIRRRLKALGQ